MADWLTQTLKTNTTTKTSPVGKTSGGDWLSANQGTGISNYKPNQLVSDIKPPSPSPSPSKSSQAKSYIVKAKANLVDKVNSILFAKSVVTAAVATTKPKATPTPAPTPQPKVKENKPFNLKENLKSGIKAANPIEQAKMSVDVVKGFLGEYAAAVKRAGTQTSSGDPNTKFVPKNPAQKVGAYGVGLGTSLVGLRGAGVDQQVGQVTQLAGFMTKNSPTVIQALAKLDQLASKFSKVPKFTIQDLRAVNEFGGVKPTAEQLKTYQKIISLADRRKVSISEILKASQGASEDTLVIKFIRNLSQGIKNLVTGKGKTGTETKLLNSGTLTPDEIIAKVATTELKNTPLGKQLVKTALEAKETGVDVAIKVSGGTVEMKAGEVVVPATQGAGEIPQATQATGGVKPSSAQQAVAKGLTEEEFVKGQGKLLPSFSDIDKNSPVLKEIDFRNAEDIIKKKYPSNEPISDYTGFLTTDGTKAAINYTSDGTHRTILNRAGIPGFSEQFYLRYGGIRLHNLPKEVNIEIGNSPTLSQLDALDKLSSVKNINYDFLKDGKIVSSSPMGGVNKQRFFKDLQDMYSIKSTSQLRAEYQAAGGVVETPPTPKTAVVEPPASEEIALVKEAVASGDLEAAKTIYDDITGEKPTFESLTKLELRPAAPPTTSKKIAIDEFGDYQKVANQMRSFVKTRGETINKETGLLYREHIPRSIFGQSSDEVADSLGMTENEFMAKIQEDKPFEEIITEKKFKEVGVPASQLPVGEGKIKVSKLEARMKGVLDNVTQDQIDSLGLSTYNQMNRKENIASAAEYAVNNPEDALKVLKGEIDAPPGIARNSIYVAMVQLAKDDVTLATKLASLSSTRMGQEISILAELDPNSPVKIMHDIYKIKEEAFKKRHGGKSVQEVVDKTIERSKGDFKPPKLSDWNSILKMVRC